MARRHIGCVRRKLAERLRKVLEADGFTVYVDPALLIPAEGYWRIDQRADVYRWEGQFQLMRDGKYQTIMADSWDTMTACAKGLTYVWDRPHQIEVFAE